MTKNQKGFAIALAVCVLSAFIAWCAGYNFDTRGPHVAAWAGATLFLAFGFGSAEILG